jgi:divalent metal cation (Fe/Co/Zn/Cd) transporter
MLALAVAKLRVGKAIANRALTTEARVTLIDAYVAAIVLGGVVANAALGWWWADPLAGLVIAAYALRESRIAWRLDIATPS